MIRAFIGAVAVAAFVAATVSASSSQAGWVDAGLDMDTAGNAARTVGNIQSCAAVEPGGTLDIDFWVTGAPPQPTAGSESGGVSGFSYNLHFDPTVVKVTAVDNRFMIVDEGDFVPFEVIDAKPENGPQGDPLPAVTGNLRVDFADISPNREGGDGVLSRITLQAIAAGSTELTLKDDQYDNYPAPSILEGNGDLNFVNRVYNGRVAVGGSCDDEPVPTPLNVGGLGGTIPGGATFPPTSPGSTASGGTSVGPTEPGQTAAPGESPGTDSGPSVAIDVVPAGNEANVVGEIETCARADAGDTFNVDLIVQGVRELLAFEAQIKYDGDILDVVGSNTKLFLAGGEGSNVNDTSAHTPDDSGRYVAGAVDLADPAEPDSGSGVLVRLTFEAKKDGASELSLKQFDSNGDGKMDEGVFLRNVDGDIIGDTNDDTFFDGPAGDAEIRVGEDCEDSEAQVVSVGGEPGSDDAEDSGGGLSGVVIGVAAAGAATAAAGAAYYVLRVRRRGGGGSEGDGGATTV